MHLSRRFIVLDNSLNHRIKQCQDALVDSWLDPLGVYRSHEQKQLRTILRNLRALHNELHELAAKANFNPSQPCIPSGQPGAGQWTSGGSGSISRTAPSDNQSDNPTDNAVFTGDQANDIIPAADRREFPPDNRVVLEFEEGGPHGGHTIRDHVNKSDEYLIGEVERRGQRYSIAPSVSVVIYRAEGSFSDVRTANDLVNRALDSDQEKIDRVANSVSASETIDYRVGRTTGKEAYYSIESGKVEMRRTHSVRVVIVADRTLDRGFRVLTAFPFNQRPREQ